MKKITKILLIIMMIFINIGLVKAEPLNIKLESITVKEKSSTITVEDPVISGDDVTSNITFNEKDDYVIFTLTLKNNESDKYKITSLEDNNETSNIDIEYDFSDEYIEAGETGTVDIKITYKELLINQASLSLDNISVTVNLEKGDSSTSSIVINPITGDSIIHYVLILVVCIAGIGLIVFKKKRIGSLLVVASILLIPITTFALIKFNFQFKFTGIKIIGQFENYNVSISVGDSSEPTIRNITYGQPIGELPTAAIKEGHTFSKYVDGNNNEVTSETIITGPISISPVYTKNSYNVTVNNSQNVSEGNVSGLYEYGSEITLTAIAREGYTFTKWSNESTDNPLVLVVGASDIEIEPIYTLNGPKTATFKTGSEVNAAMKGLSGDSYTSFQENRKIMYIEKSTVEPDTTQMTDDNIVSIDDSEYPIYMWYDSSNRTIYWWSEADITYLNEDSSRMFYYLRSLQILDVSEYDTSNVTDMNNMFEFCFSLTELDLSMWNTGNVTDMSGMFSFAEKMTKIDLSNINTGNVIDMSQMFFECKKLESLDVSSFDTSNVTDMYQMFMGTELISELDLSNFNTSNVTNMGALFNQMTALTRVDLSSFDTSNVINMSSMFSSNSGIIELDLSNFDTSKVEDFRNMFNHMNNVERIYASDKFVIISVDTAEGNNRCLGAFENNLKLVGGMGTNFSIGRTSCDFAHVDEGLRNPGYFTYRDKVLLTFDPNGGSVNIESTFVNKGSAIGSLASPIRRGYRFIGWYTEAEEGNLITTESIINNETTVFAHWVEEPNQPLISYSDANPDGIVSTGDYVMIGDEDFLVISSGNGSIKLLARYNLDANYRQSEANYVTMTFADDEYWTNRYNAASSSFGEADDINNYYSSEYNREFSEYGNNSYENSYYIYRNKDNYDTPNNLVNYINNYKTHLIDDLGISNLIDVRLVKFSELDNTKCFRSYSSHDDNCDDWLINQKYWVGSVYYSRNISGEILAINNECNAHYGFGCLYCGYDIGSDEYGVRALVEIPYNLIDVKYVVNFDSQGGSEVNSIVFLNNSDVSNVKVLPTPTKKGMIFAGWYTDINYKTPFNHYTVVDKNMTVYAKWLNELTGDTESINSIVIDKLQSATIEFNDVGEDLTFVSSDLNIATVDSNGLVTGVNPGETTITVTGKTSGTSKTISVKVNPLYFTLTFENYGEYIEKESVSIEMFSAIGDYTLPIPYKTGYTFIGWYTDMNYNTKIDVGYTVEDDMVLYARWIKSVIDVDTTNYLTMDKGFSMSIDVSDEIEEEYTFISNDSNIATVDSNGLVTGVNPGDTIITVTGSISGKSKNINVTINKIYYTITLNPNGGTVNKESVKIEVGTAIGAGTLPNAQNSSLVFDGWYTESDGGIKITSETVPVGNTTYYAHWIEGTLNSIVDVDNDGIVSTGDMITLGDDEFYVLSTGNNIIKLLAKYNLDANYRQSENFVTTTYSETNYWFNEAASSSSSSSNSGGAIASNFNYNSYGMPYIYRDKDNNDTANNLKQYINNYSAHLTEDMGVTGIIDVRLADFSELVIGDCNEWGYCYNDENNIDWNILPILEFNHDYWLGSSHETFMADHDAVNYYDMKNNIINNAVYNYEKFEYEEDTHGIKPLVELSTSVIEHKYIVEFESNEGSIINPIVFLNSNNNPTISKLPIPKKDGYDFKGWYKDSGFNTKVEDGVSITEDTKLYAKWEPALIIYIDSDISGTLSMGDQIKIGNEEFYYIGEDGDNAKLITKYSLGPDFKQDSTQSFKLAYSETSYWSDEDDSFNLASDYAVDSEGYGYIYRKADGSDTDNNFAGYINIYKDYLINTLGASDVLDARMLSYADAYNTGCVYGEGNSCPPFMAGDYGSGYDIGSTYESNYVNGMIWRIIGYSLTISDDSFQHRNQSSIRPLIVIPKSNIIK